MGKIKISPASPLGKEQANSKGSKGIMGRAIGKLRDKQLSLRCRFKNSLWGEPCDRNEPSIKRWSTNSKNINNNNNNNDNHDQLGQWAKKGKLGMNLEKQIEFSERQNSVSTFELYKYATRLELGALFVGMLLMVYAASWQPISVFILAIMASLMGQYSRQTQWLSHLADIGHQPQAGGQSGSAAGQSNSSLQEEQTVISANQINQPIRLRLASLLGPLSEALDPQQVVLDAEGNHSSSDNRSPPIEAYDKHSFLGASLSSMLGNLFDSASGGHLSGDSVWLGGGNQSLASSRPQELNSSLHQALGQILNDQSEQFLRKSFEINATAFLLALTQLFGFFVGLALICWAARRQASRVKVLYFSSCLYQEVTWFEAIDSASGSGSSLNGLVEKYEDGIGMKLALLCYFLGHVSLFALSAFYQMFSLAAFCMPFVLLIGFIICYLSKWQAIAIGENALFAKRSLQLAEEILAAIRTIFAFNGQQKEITRYSLSLGPVYRKSIVKHLYTALNVALSKFSIFACFAIYCFYARHLFPPHSHEASGANKSTILAVMRGAEVSIVNILISIPFMEALQQSKGSIARIFLAIERRSRIAAHWQRGLKLDTNGATWKPSISFRMVQFGYVDRSGPSRRRSTLPFLNLAPLEAGQEGSSHPVEQHSPHTVSAVASKQGGATSASAQAGQQLAQARRRSLIEELAEEALEAAHAHQAAGESGGPAERRKVLVGRPAPKRPVGSRRAAPAGVLRNFNLDILPGQSVALVGASGSGKSTVLALVQRLYDITGGQLLVGGQDIKDLNVAWLRSQIGLVGQEPRLFDLSIAENIALGLASGHERAQLRLDAEGVWPRVVEAARAVGAHQFIAQLPHGYATRTGSSAGVQLSGGQKQRIAIARALIRRPKILLLDECTSALDTESEAQVLEALRTSAAANGATTLVVAHRLETIKRLDLIVVMHEGRVVACGSHEQLMAAGASNSSSKETDLGAKLYVKMYQEQCKSSAGNGLGKLEEEPLESPDPKLKRQTGTDDLKGGQEWAEKTRESKGVSKVLGGFQNDKDENLLQTDEEHAKEGRVLANFDHYLNEQQQLDDQDQEEDEDRSVEEMDEDKQRPPGQRLSFLQLWRFVEMPKWSACISVIVCLMSGLILPLNLIAHSYLFSVFAYNELEQIGAYLHVFGLMILSFSTFVFVVSFLQILLPGYVGEKLNIRLRVKTMDSLLQKPMFYFDMSSNSAGSLSERFNGYINSIQNIAGTRIAIILEAISTLFAGALFGLGQNLTLSLFCLSFALTVLVTTIIESKIIELETSVQQKYDCQLAHLMADSLANIKTIASLNREEYFIERYKRLLELRDVGCGTTWRLVHTFLTSLKFVMPALSWSASMFYGSYLLANNRIDLQTIYIVCPVVLFAVNDTFRALVFLPELLRARKCIDKLYRLNQEFSPQALRALTFAQQLEAQERLHLEQSPDSSNSDTAPHRRRSSSSSPSLGSPSRRSSRAADGNGGANMLEPAGQQGRKKSRVSFALEPPSLEGQPELGEQTGETTLSAAAGDQLGPVNRRLSRLQELPSYMDGRRRSRLNSLVPRAQARGRIEFRDVEFAYPNRPGALVLDGFSLAISPGESVALVGSSGSGKSTTVAILEKFYDFHAGSVTLDGRDLRLVEPHWVRSQIGLVQQEPCLLSYTIGDNIRYGDNARFVPMHEVVEAARVANIHDFIMSLPDGYDTQLASSAYSGSCQLSGGQRQRIAIARALIRRAPILIFDEPTSALDNTNEQVVQDALDKAKQGRTSVTIAHRLATIRTADKIVVMREGRVVEVGTHEQLMGRQPATFYRALWERQEGRPAAPEQDNHQSLQQQQGNSSEEQPAGP